MRRGRQNYELKVPYLTFTFSGREKIFEGTENSRGRKNAYEVTPLCLKAEQPPGQARATLGYLVYKITKRPFLKFFFWRQ